MLASAVVGPGPDLSRWQPAQVVVADAAARTQELLARSEALASLQRSVVHALALYRKTRPQASPQSVARAKALPQEGMHPLLAAQVPTNTMAGLEAQVSLQRPEVQAHTLYCMRLASPQSVIKSQGPAPGGLPAGCPGPSKFHSWPGSSGGFVPGAAMCWHIRYCPPSASNSWHGSPPESHLRRGAVRPCTSANVQEPPFKGASSKSSWQSCKHSCMLASRKCRKVVWSCAASSMCSSSSGGSPDTASLHASQATWRMSACSLGCTCPSCLCCRPGRWRVQLRLADWQAFTVLMSVISSRRVLLAVLAKGGAQG